MGDLIAALAKIVAWATTPPDQRPKDWSDPNGLMGSFQKNWSDPNGLGGTMQREADGMNFNPSTPLSAWSYEPLSPAQDDW
jgi:hypothetical protein